MGFWKWLFGSNGGAKCLPEDLGLPTPNRPAPPMPACKPNKPELDISEPVIKLLTMLDEDVWELVEGLYGVCHLVHVYKEDFKIQVVELGARYGERDRWIPCGYDWATADEEKLLQSKFTAICQSLKAGNTSWRYSCTRLKFKQYLETI